MFKPYRRIQVIDTQLYTPIIIDYVYSLLFNLDFAIFSNMVLLAHSL